MQFNFIYIVSSLTLIVADKTNLCQAL